MKNSGAFIVGVLTVLLAIGGVTAEEVRHTNQTGSIQIKSIDEAGLAGMARISMDSAIRILTGITKADSGRVLIDGHNVNTQSAEIKKIINAFPESTGYYEWMTAYEYLWFFSGLYEYGESKQEICKLLEGVGLSGKENHLVCSFSRGMKQRLGIARALINKPKLLFLDEPTNGLDPGGRRDIHDLLTDLNRKQGTTIFLSTHLLDWVRSGQPWFSV